MHNLIFVSVTHQLTERQSHFLHLINAFLKMHHLEPVTVGRTVASENETIFHIRDNIEASRAVLVIAFKKAEVITVTCTALPEPAQPRQFMASVWNHIEAAMAIQAKKPFLILCEQGIYVEGVFKWKTRPSHFFDLDDSGERLSKEITTLLHTWIALLEES